MLKEFFPDKNLNQTLNPDEAVAKGATILAGILSGCGQARRMELKDCTSLSIGVQDNEGRMVVVIPRNTVYPTRKGSTTFEIEDNTSFANIYIYQGEKEMAEDNTHVAIMKVESIHKYGELHYSIDEDGIIQFRAYPQGQENGGNIAELKITQESLNMNKEQITEASKAAKKDSIIVENVTYSPSIKD